MTIAAPSGSRIKLHVARRTEYTEPHDETLLHQLMGLPSCPLSLLAPSEALCEKKVSMPQRPRPGDSSLATLLGHKRSLAKLCSYTTPDEKHPLSLSTLRHVFRAMCLPAPRGGPSDRRRGACARRGSSGGVVISGDDDESRSRSMSRRGTRRITTKLGTYLRLVPLSARSHLGPKVDVVH